MESINKLLKVATDHRDEILNNSVMIEELLNRGEGFVDEKKVTISNLSDSIFESIEKSCHDVLKVLENGIFTKVFKNYSVDIPRLLYIPKTFDFTDNNELENLLIEKVRILQESFSSVKNNSLLNETFFNELAEVIEILFRISKNFNNTVFGLQEELKKGQFSELTQSLSRLSDIIFGLEYNDDSLNRFSGFIEPLARGLVQSVQSGSLLGYVKKISEKIPEIAKELPPLKEKINLKVLSEQSVGIIDIMEDKVPFVIDELFDVNLSSISSDNIRTKINVINKSLTELWELPEVSNLINSVKSNFGLKDYDIGVELLLLFKIPNNIDWKDISAVTNFIKSKWDELWKAFEKINLFDDSLKERFAEFRKIIDDLFDSMKIDSLNSISDLLISLLKGVIEHLGEIPNLSTITQFIYEKLKDLYELLTYFFKNELKFTIKEYQIPERRSARDVFESRVGLMPESKNTQKVLEPISKSNTFKELESNSLKRKNLLERIIVFIDSLSPEDAEHRDVLSQMYNGGWMNSFKGDLFKELFEKEGLFEMVEGKKDAFLTFLVEKQRPFGAIMDQFLRTLVETVLELVKKGKTIVSFILESISQLLISLLKTIKQVKIPDEWMPDLIRDTFINGENPNIICLLLAIPITVLESILGSSLNNLRTI